MAVTEPTISELSLALTECRRERDEARSTQRIFVNDYENTIIQRDAALARAEQAEALKREAEAELNYWKDRARREEQAGVIAEAESRRLRGAMRVAADEARDGYADGAAFTLEQALLHQPEPPTGAGEES